MSGLLAFAGGVKSLVGGGSKKDSSGVRFGETFQQKLEAWKMGVGSESDRTLYNGQFRQKLAELEKAVGTIAFGSSPSTGAGAVNKFTQRSGSVDLSNIPSWAKYVGLAVVAIGAFLFFKRKKRR